MTDDPLDELLASLPTPPPRPGFWDEIDAAIAETATVHEAVGDVDGRHLVVAAEQHTIGVDVEPDPLTDPDTMIEPGSVIGLDRERARRRQQSIYWSAIAGVAAVFLVLIIGIGGLSDRESTTGPAGVTAPADSSSVVDPPSSAPSSTVFDSTDGFVDPALVERLVPDGTTVVFNPKYLDVNGDGVGDVVAMVQLADGPLAVLTVDGATGQASEHLPIDGITVGSFVVRPGRITITTLNETGQIVTEVNVDDGGGLTVDRVTGP